MIDKVYVTKYALTNGVRLCNVIDLGTEWVRVEWPGGWPGVAVFKLGTDAHVHSNDARWRLDVMREKAIKAAERKLERLRAMKFEVKE